MDQLVACYKDMWVNWNNFSGRTRRSGYWYAVLANFLVALLLSLAVAAVDPLSIILDIYQLVVLVPSIALGVRRLHDTGHSGLWYLLMLTGIGAIVLLVWFCKDSGPDNKYGPSPKGYRAAPGGYPAGPEGYPSYPSYPSYPTYPTYPQGPESGYRDDNSNDGPELK